MNNNILKKILIRNIKENQLPYAANIFLVENSNCKIVCTKNSICINSRDQRIEFFYFIPLYETYSITNFDHIIPILEKVKKVSGNNKVIEYLDYPGKSVIKKEIFIGSQLQEILIWDEYGKLKLETVLSEKGYQTFLYGVQVS